MGQLGLKMRTVEGGLAHWCPACEEMHVFTLAPNRNASNAQWTWNGNVEAPTFQPSMNIRWGRQADPKCEVDGGICHYTITAGVISFAAECTHGFRGQSMALPDLPPHLRD